MVATAEQISSSSSVTHQVSRWVAQLQLGLSLKHDQTVLTKRRHVGPLTLQRPFYPEENGTCHLYILHPPGGVVGGDILNVDVHCMPSTETLITTPAANKFYQSNGIIASQNQELVVEGRAKLEWLPQETILFNGARVDTKTIIKMDAEATFFGWEIISFGRPACGEVFSFGEYKQSYEIWCDQEPLLIDRLTIQDRAELFNGMWGLQAQPVMGLITVVNSEVSILENAQLKIQTKINESTKLSVTIVGNVLICRCLGKNVMSVRDKFIEIWKSIREITMNKAPCEPRIWAT